MEYFLLESALLMLAAYFVGAILGCLLRRLFTPRRPKKDIGGDTAAAAAAAAGTSADAATQLRGAPEPVQPKIETVADASPPEDSGVAESARFERVLTAAPAEAEGEATSQSEGNSETTAAEDSSAAATAAAAAIAAGAAAASALASEKDKTPAPPSAAAPTPAPPAPAQPAVRYPSVGGTGGMSSVSAPIADPGPPADDLRRIEGIDAETATSLNQLGYTRFAQLADWKMADIKRVTEAFGDTRATAGGWVEQARMLADGKETGHLRRLAGKGTASAWATLAAAAAPVAAAAAVAETKPAADAPTPSPGTPVVTGPVDLRLIEGIDDKTNAILVQNGITNFKQIAFWKREDVAQMDQLLGEPGRISRENWIEQARMLDDGKTTHFTQHKPTAVAVSPPATSLPDPEPLPAPQSGSGAAVATAAATAAVSAATATAPEPEPVADNDLKRIEGIDATAETLLKSNGIQAYSQIAKWTSSDVQKFDGMLQQPGRISRENWIEQAKILADGKETAFTSGRQNMWPASEAAAAPVAAVTANEPDDLMRIQGIDAGVRDMLNSKGVKSFAQISKWTPAHVEKVDSILGEAGRVSRENWIGQAQALATGAPMPETATAAAPEAPAPSASEPASSSASAATAAAAASSATAPAPDDLKRISGIDTEIEAMLHSKGVRSYGQISKWTAAHVNKVDSLLSDTGRVERENWVEQARLLAEGKDPAAAQSAPPSAAEPAPAPARPARLADAIRQNTGSGGHVSNVAGMRSVRSELLSGPNKTPEIVDDLKKIRGIGVLIEKKLNAMGVFAYEQIANWSAGEIERVSNALDFKGRIEREGWVQQARILASGGQTEFSKRLS